jgi:hypothetical protein
LRIVVHLRAAMAEGGVLHSWLLRLWSAVDTSNELRALCERFEAACVDKLLHCSADMRVLGSEGNRDTLPFSPRAGAAFGAIAADWPVRDSRAFIS